MSSNQKFYDHLEALNEEEKMLKLLEGIVVERLISRWACGLPINTREAIVVEENLNQEIWCKQNTSNSSGNIVAEISEPVKHHIIRREIKTEDLKENQIVINDEIKEEVINVEYEPPVSELIEKVKKLKKPKRKSSTARKRSGDTTINPDLVNDNDLIKEDIETILDKIKRLEDNKTVYHYTPSNFKSNRRDNMRKHLIGIKKKLELENKNI